jgi:L-histidine N-alpha-methyltransferase
LHHVATSGRYSDAVLEFARAALRGLSDTPRWLPCQYLYDARGSELFEAISRQPEYYPTRTEAGILERHARDIRDLTGPVTLIELGSGSSIKTSLLLSAYAAAGDGVRYVPVDVSKSALEGARQRIEREHPTVELDSITGRYEEAFPLLHRYSPAMVLFLGSTIGNFNNGESLAFWRRVARDLAPGDYFLLGVDLVKDPEVLNAAYNDSAGVTAEFTTNLFARMNRELDAGVDVSQLGHLARYNPDWQRMEIFTRFDAAQTVRIGPLGRTVAISAGEQVMIEISRKFVLDDLATYLDAFDLATRAVYTDDRDWFAVLLLQKGRRCAADTV